VNHEEWLISVPEVIKGDSLWKMEAYRLALFATDLGWHDVTKLMGDKRTVSLSDQLFRALGSISANISEGYSRISGRDRARYYFYALGSARESRGWYYQGRFILGDLVSEHRLDLLTQIIRLLVTMIPQQRQKAVKEESALYTVFDHERLDQLLACIPMPESIGLNTFL
jgi:four helix bundle protein